MATWLLAYFESVHKSLSVQFEQTRGEQRAIVAIDGSHLMANILMVCYNNLSDTGSFVQSHWWLAAGSDPCSSATLSLCATRCVCLCMCVCTSAD